FVIFFFFFSSRRRHTRSYGDWSSDVCSSDLHDSCRRVEVLVVPQRRMIGRAPGFQEPAASHHGLSTVVVHFGTQENLDRVGGFLDRKSTRLNSSHRTISYAVFCLKKKNKVMQ